MTPGIPVLKDLVLVGGGHSHVGVIKGFGMDPMPGVRLTVISRDVQAPYSGMLPGLIAGHYTFDEAHIDLRPLARFAGARFVHAEVVGIDPEQRLVALRDRPPVPYDLVSINIGSTPGLTVPGAAEAVVPVKPIDGFWRRWERLRDRCLERRGETRIAVVGGGAGGVELLLSVQHRLSELLAASGRTASHLGFHLITATEEILPSHNSRVRAKFVRFLAERGVSVHTGRAVVRVAAAPAGGRHRLELDGGESLDFDDVLWVTTARAASWLGDSGLRVDERGFIEVEDTLQAVGNPDIFAAGDVAAVVDHPRPKAGVFAVRQGPPLTANVRARLLDEPAVPFRPQRQFLSLISTGDRYAVASRGEWAAEGSWVWRWKDRIDRRFMRDYNELPEMPEDAPAADPPDPRLIGPEAASELVRQNTVALRDVPEGLTDQEKAAHVLRVPGMRCGGCGAKVGADLLTRALSRLPLSTRDDVIVGLDHADDAAVVEIPAGTQIVQTTDFFRTFIADPYLFGAVAANHALGDVFAMGAEPRFALATVVMPHGLVDKVEADLVQLLAGALDVLEAEGAALVGGHTAEGGELAAGFTVTGVVGVGEARGICGLRPGDGLILTKPVGTGALLAADARGRAKGRWIESALRSMKQSNRAAAACLIEHGATALTDVSGFGLLREVAEMAAASGTSATLQLDRIPLLEGARRVIEGGFVSSLQPANLAAARTIVASQADSHHPAFPLLFDPQTAGGLLAGVPRANVVACIDALRSLGYGSATDVGAVTDDGEGAVRVLS